LFGETEAMAIAGAIENEVQASVRLNPFKPSDVFESEEIVPWCNEGRFLAQRPSFIADPLFHAGAYYVQESSSMFLSHVFKSLFIDKNSSSEQHRDSGTGLKVLDLCAAPGGKSTLLASCLSNDDLLVSNEMIKSRVRVLDENMIKWGRANVIISNNDAKDFGKMTHFFDCIVVDAPCSGEGLFRKDKFAVEEWSESNVQLCAARQQRIIADVLPALKPGGFLIYSTCTFNTLENEENVAWMMKEFALGSVEIKAPDDWQISGSLNDISVHSYRFLPHKVRGEGLFMAVLQKPVGPVQVHKNNTKQLNFASKKYLPELQKWLDEPEQFDYIMKAETYAAIPKHLIEDYTFCRQHLHIKNAGISMGRFDKKGQLAPEHSLALSIHLSKEVNRIALNLPDSLLYLRKQVFSLNDTMEKGWYLATYRGFGLGWMKILPDRINNYLPAENRILKVL